MTLGQKMKALRLEKGLSQPELAAKAGIEQSYLSKLENDKSIPSNDMLRALLDALDVSLETMMADTALEHDYVRLRQIPDVDAWLTRRGVARQAGQRLFLYTCTLFVLVAVTLLYMGQAKQPFGEVHYEYASDGVVLEGEPKDVFRKWRSLLDATREDFHALRHNKEMEMNRRYDELYILSAEYLGPQFVQTVEGGSRFYRLHEEKQIRRSVNDWLRVVGVFFLSAGVIGFFLERRLYRSGL